MAGEATAQAGEDAAGAAGAGEGWWVQRWEPPSQLPGEHGKQHLSGQEEGARAAKGAHAQGWQEQAGQSISRLGMHRVVPKRMPRGTRGPGLVMPLLCMAEGASKQPCCCLQAALGSPSRPMSLPGRSPGCKGSAGSGSAGDTPSGRGVGGEKEGESGGKARDRERGNASRRTTAAAALGRAPFSIA